MEKRGYEGAALYRPSLLVMVGVLALGFAANLLVRPVSARFHEVEGSVPDHHTGTSSTPRPPRPPSP
jgi:hypothetical protein